MSECRMLQWNMSEADRYLTASGDLLAQHLAVIVADLYYSQGMTNMWQDTHVLYTSTVLGNLVQLVP